MEFITAVTRIFFFLSPFFPRGPDQYAWTVASTAVAVLPVPVGSLSLSRISYATAPAPLNPMLTHQVGPAP